MLSPNVRVLSLVTLCACAAAPAHPQRERPTRARTATAVVASSIPVTCPSTLPAGTSCVNFIDRSGAKGTAVRPANWNGTLVLFNHGGPRYTGGGPNDSSAGDHPLIPSELGGEYVIDYVKRGFAFAASAYLQQGYIPEENAIDSENARLSFAELFVPPSRTIIHGSSYGALVGARQVELFPTTYAGALLVGGEVYGTLKEGMRSLDFRVVAQYYCRNSPYPHERQYPLYLGLDPGDPRSPWDKYREFADRLNACTGLARAPADRTPAQAAAHRNIFNVMHLTEPRSVLADQVAWMIKSTLWLFERASRIGFKNAFTNRHAQYSGSDDDAGLNAGVLRHDADPEAVEYMRRGDPTGITNSKVLSFHNWGDGRVPVEGEHAYHRAFELANNAHNHAMVFATNPGHGTSAPQNHAGLGQLLNWINAGTMPTPKAYAVACASAQRIPLTGVCDIDLTGYTPNSWWTINAFEGRRDRE